MEFLDKLFQKMGTAASSAKPPVPTKKLMTSQLPALYLKDNHRAYRADYMRRLMEIGFSEENAEKMFAFECDVIRRYGDRKSYLSNPLFTELWLFNLEQPFFQQHPKTRGDILKEKFLTVSELCKLVDEAEWHFWNSHERNLSDEVWNEIFDWHLKGPGMIFAMAYFDMIEKETGVPMSNLNALCNLQGSHLSKYKWRANKQSDASC